FTPESGHSGTRLECLLKCVVLTWNFPVFLRLAPAVTVTDQNCLTGGLAGTPKRYGALQYNSGSVCNKSDAGSLRRSQFLDSAHVMTGHAYGKQGDANNQGNEPAAHLRFHGLTLFFRSVAAACQCFPQHLKNDCSRPPEQQHSVHSGHWAQQPP